MIVYPSFWITMKWFLINQEKEKKWKSCTCQDFLSIFYQDPHLFSVDTLIQANLDLRKIYLLNLKNRRLKYVLKYAGEFTSLNLSFKKDLNLQNLKIEISLCFEKLLRIGIKFLLTFLFLDTVNTDKVLSILLFIWNLKPPQPHLHHQGNLLKGIANKTVRR